MRRPLLVALLVLHAALMVLISQTPAEVLDDTFTRSVYAIGAVLLVMSPTLLGAALLWLQRARRMRLPASRFQFHTRTFLAAVGYLAFTIAYYKAFVISMVVPALLVPFIGIGLMLRGVINSSAARSHARRRQIDDPSAQLYHSAAETCLLPPATGESP